MPAAGGVLVLAVVEPDGVIAVARCQIPGLARPAPLQAEVPDNHADPVAVDVGGDAERIGREAPTLM